MARDESSTLDWATQAWLNLAAIIDDGLPGMAEDTIRAFLEQAPDDIKGTARTVRDLAGLAPPGHRTPQIGDMVRVDNDPGYGVKGAIAMVHGIYDDDTLSGAVLVTIAGRRFHLEAKDVTVVTYDNTTRTWAEVPG